MKQNSYDEKDQTLNQETRKILTLGVSQARSSGIDEDLRESD